jgi:predicted phage terminase large subunit-like protein
MEPEEWFVLSFDAFDSEKEKMLCSEILSYEELKDREKKISPSIYLANWFNKPVDVLGRLFKEEKIKTYIVPKDISKMGFERIVSPLDGADKGDNYLCAGAVGVREGKAFLLDVYYTQEDQDTTPEKCADTFFKNDVNYVRLESQAGGEGLKREIERILWDKYKTRSIDIETFSQRGNKEARIKEWSSWVLNHVYFPDTWKSDFPEFYRDVTTYQANGKNKYDDAPDFLTMIGELIESDFYSDRSGWS